MLSRHELVSVRAVTVHLGETNNQIRVTREIERSLLTGATAVTVLTYDLARRRSNGGGACR